MINQNRLLRNPIKNIYRIASSLSLMFFLSNVAVLAQAIPAKHRIPSQTKIINGYDPDKAYIIFKADSDEKLNQLKSEIKADGGSITVSNLKRNNKGHITSINLEYTEDEKSMVRGVYDDENLNSIVFGTQIDGGVFLSKSDNTGRWLKNKEPLIYIDGKKANKTEMDNIHPDKISVMNVVKGKKAMEKYGEEAVDGVIEIMTKSD